MKHGTSHVTKFYRGMLSGGGVALVLTLDSGLGNRLDHKPATLISAHKIT